MRNPSHLKLKKLQNRTPVAFTPRYGVLSTDTNARRKNHGQKIFEQSLKIKHDSHLKLPMLSSPKNNNDISSLKFSQMRKTPSRSGSFSNLNNSPQSNLNIVRLN